MGFPIKHFLSLSVFFLFGISLFAQQWPQIGANINGEAAGDFSGRSLSMPTSKTVAIGAPFNSGNGYLSGHVRVFEFNGTSWIQKGIDLDGDTVQDFFGVSVSMPNTKTLAVGSDGHDGNASNDGVVRIYSWKASAWQQMGGDIIGEASQDNSGFAVSMPDSVTVAIGAIGNSGNGANAGHTRIYTWNGSAWIQKGMDIDGESAGDESGSSVSMPDANTVAIGAPFNDGRGVNAGHVRIYSWNGSAWVQKGVDLDGESANDNSGYSVCMPDANTVAIGAHQNDGTGSDAGHVRIYKWNGTSWNQKGTDIDGETAGDLSGRSVWMPDSNHIAIGAPNAYGQTGRSGHVRIYKWDCAMNMWVRYLLDFDGERNGDFYGFSVCMPTVGNLAAGATHNNGGQSSTSNKGHTRIYSGCLPPTTCFAVTSCGDYKSPGGNIWTTSKQYTDVLQSKTGCDSILKIDLTIIPFDKSCQVSRNVITARQAGATYQWLDCTNGYSLIPGATKQSFVSQNNGDFAVIISTPSCTDTSSCYTINSIDIEEISQQFFRVFPNPSSSGQFYIEFNEHHSEVALTLSDNMGQVLDRYTFQPSLKFNFNIEGSSGLYFLRLDYSNGQHSIIKIIKE